MSIKRWQGASQVMVATNQTFEVYRLGTGSTVSTDEGAGTVDSVSSDPLQAGDTLHTTGSLASATLTFVGDALDTTTGQVVGFIADFDGHDVLFVDGTNPVGSGDTIMNENGDYTVTPACFVQGTLISTPGSDVPVEELAIGDQVTTASGRTRAIKWIGRRHYSGRFANNNPDLLPICFKVGSLADRLPARDLWVSPKHAMFLNDLLIPAEYLVNGVSIVKAGRVDEVAYFHIELETHDVLLAEGAAAESFMDDDSRGMFQNAHEYATLYGEGKKLQVRSCAPRIEDGDVLEKIRHQLARRAGLVVSNPMSFGKLIGDIDHADQHGVSGWAQDLAFPDAPVCLDVFADGVLVGQIVAEHSRAGADQTGGYHGFELALPGTPVDRIEVRRSADGALLTTAVLVSNAAA